MVFQSYALYPHMTVAENIGFHLKVKRVPKAERAQRVREAARSSTSSQYLDRKPAKLSGGQRQRVAMGRAIVREPQVFLMDEPLSNLDAKLRVQTRTQIAALQRRLARDDRVRHPRPGRGDDDGRPGRRARQGVLQQCATPKELFTDPVNLFVAGFIGSPAMNLLDGRRSATTGRTHGTLTVPLTPEQRAASTSDAVTIGVRPEDWTLAADGGLDDRGRASSRSSARSRSSYCTDETGDAITGKPIVARAEGLSADRAGRSGAASCPAPTGCTCSSRRPAPACNALSGCGGGDLGGNPASTGSRRDGRRAPRPRLELVGVLGSLRRRARRRHRPRRSRSSTSSSLERRPRRGSISSSSSRLDAGGHRRWPPSSSSSVDRRAPPAATYTGSRGLRHRRQQVQRPADDQGERHPLVPAQAGRARRPRRCAGPRPRTARCRSRGRTSPAAGRRPA